MKILKKLFEGRLNRGNYIKGLIVLPFIICIPAFLIGLISKEYFLLLTITLLILFLLALSLNIRRHHDLNQGWYYPLLAILVIGVLSVINNSLGSLASFLYMLYLIIKVGSKRKNNYGDEDVSKGWKTILGLNHIKNEKQK